MKTKLIDWTFYTDADLLRIQSILRRINRSTDPAEVMYQIEDIALTLAERAEAEDEDRIVNGTRYDSDNTDY